MNIYDIDTDEHLIPFEPSRARIDIQVGAMVRRESQIFRILQILNFEVVIGVEVESGKSASLRISELHSVEQEKVDGLYVNYDIATIGSDEWATAQQRFSVISPLLNQSVTPRSSVEAQAKLAGVDTATVYRWLDRYRNWGEVLALVPRKRGWKAGNTRLTTQDERLIEEVIEDHYLTKQRPSIQSAIAEVDRRAKVLGMKAPGASAIRARISRISEKQFLRRRGFADKARNRFTPAVGKFPGADYPMSVVQIDHTPVDLIVVDDVHRRPIGRLWLTVAIDVFSRMITGYYLALEEPSEISVAMCIAHSVLPKEEWLDVHGVKGEWPVWGFPRVIHSDNGADFHTANLKRSCSNYNIENVFRPVARPNFGGHIERLLGTFMRTLHELPGTTFSSIAAREGYDSERNAVLTMAEFEMWLVRSILKYHQNIHSAIYMSPARMWQIGFFGNRETDALVGMPPRPADPLTVQLDFLPSFQRTVQHYGVQIDVFYYSEALRHWINATDPQTGQARKFVFRRDPRDISTIWFFDPALKQYFKIPVANQAFPASTVWEFRAAKKKAVSEGRENIDEALIARLILENRQLVEQASANTKKARKQAQKARVHEKRVTPATVVAMPKPSPAIASGHDDLLLDDVELLGDIS
ncbi:Mu transposase C-terminal domain-containing protein [Pseudomonas yamanorum]|uniref:Mu transposase C-terminal domain-containing protein n=1 Tax=Pseudomonas yamanorum TaxID=515393 RepID=UPI002ED23DE9|nr:Mu transposase C-terminal domain-containing protein [Pseudomonas yamanorum]